MSDLISRSMAFEEFNKDPMGGLNYRQILETLPSAQSERKSGEWFIEPNKGNISCSICKEEFSYYPSIGIKPIWDYCPYCGSYNGG